MSAYCPTCGTQTAAVEVDHGAGSVTCPSCGDERPFRSLPLHVVVGASGTGKTTAWRRVVGTIDAAVLDWDITTFDEDGGYGAHLRELADGPRTGFWLRLSANLHRSGVQVVLFTGAVGPDEIADRPESRYFPTVRYLALTCDAGTLRERLRDRRGWEWARDEGFPWADLDLQTSINAAYREAAADPDSPVTAVDTGERTPPEVATRLREWVQRGLG
ncbi:hypothetical protein DP107_08430 [Haloglomus irregulare]|uniref:Broad-specificity NMP kinase n=1 Tax=Haloglomus irregulare TaxID=2234134 RepID=A0A554NA38_9EURY|nr:hypothetical protein [Haloglomus irregulare]TSD14267.1 hypothetical protein DP107_08430 [Haloglomus irregulare]